LEIDILAYSKLLEKLWCI